MANWEMAVMAMIAVSSIGFLLSDAERRRLCWVQAMRRCLMRMDTVIRYEQPSLEGLLLAVQLHATPQERALCGLLHACAQKLRAQPDAQLALLFAQESARLADYGVLSEADRTAFEAVLGDLGRLRMGEQLMCLGSAQERLRSREETLAREGGRRARLIRSLGAAGGAAVFLILI